MSIRAPDLPMIAGHANVANRDLRPILATPTVSGCSTQSGIPVIRGFLRDQITALPSLIWCKGCYCSEGTLILTALSTCALLPTSPGLSICALPPSRPSPADSSICTTLPPLPALPICSVLPLSPVLRVCAVLSPSPALSPCAVLPAYLLYPFALRFHPHLLCAAQNPANSPQEAGYAI
eukprot:1148314-Pelagomonas_calceolata.AAC.10